MASVGGGVEMTSSLLAKAISIAAFAHDGQVDKQGQPYILHVMDVIMRCETDEQRTVAALHDVVEDTPMSIGSIANTFGADISEAVDAITKRPNEAYDAYLHRVSQNPLAAAVKVFDIYSNVSRINSLEKTQPEVAQRLKSKYAHAIMVLVTQEQQP